MQGKQDAGQIFALDIGTRSIIGIVGQEEKGRFHVAAIEKEHEERYLKLLENIKEDKVFKGKGKVKWQCGNCGHVYEGDEAPEVCPVCAHPQSYFRVKAENY